MQEHDAAGELNEVDWDRILVADTDQDVIERWQRIVGAFFMAFDRATLAAWSLEHGWGLSPIIRLSEVPESPQMKARGIFDNGLPGPLFAVHPEAVT